MRLSISSLLLNPKTRKIRKLHTWQWEGESEWEFRGRWLCEVEDVLRIVLDVERQSPVPAGTSWVAWENRGHVLKGFSPFGIPTLYTHTGELYQNRYTTRPPLIDGPVEAERELRRLKAALAA